mgnify:FL=1
MVKKLSLLLILCATSSTAFTDTSHLSYEEQLLKGETWGFFSGAILGGAAGGPPGVVIGAGIGALFGDGWNTMSQANDLQASLNESQVQLAVVKNELEIIKKEHLTTQTEIDLFRKAPPQILPAFLSTQPTITCCDNTVVSIHFRTGSSDIELHYKEQLESMATLAKKMTNAKVEITGYSDRNGEPSRNLNLSQQRSDSVKSFFMEMGIDNTLIATLAYGETRPLQLVQDFETDFYDRRVIVRLRDSSQSMLTQTPDDQKD